MRNDRERLLDIVEAANKVGSRVARGREHFDTDEDAQLALVRLIEIIGEACANLSTELVGRYHEVPWRAAAGMRNRVIHGYFDIDLDLVWTAAEQEVPKLASAASSALGDDPDLQEHAAEGDGN